MTNPTNGFSIGQPYPLRTRGAALAASLAFWALFSERFPSAFTATMPEVPPWVAPLGLLGVAMGATAMLVQSLPKGRERDAHLMCAYLPGVAVAAYLALVAGPIFELLRPGAALEQWSSEPWSGVTRLSWSGAAGVLFGGTHFLIHGTGRAIYVTAFAIATALAIAFGLPIDFGRAVSELFVDLLLAAALGGFMVWGALALWRAVELDSGLRKPVFSLAEQSQRTKAYERVDHERLVGVALSGGGYRASLFTLGALMYVHDACARAEGLRRRIAAVSSVSGGSLTNALAGHAVALGRGGPDAIDRIAHALVRHVAHAGSMFSGQAKLYYFALLPAMAVGLAVLAGFAVRGMTLELFWRTTALLVVSGGVMGLFVAGDRLLRRIKPGPLEFTLWLIHVLVGLAVLGALLILVLGAPAWRTALAWLDLAAIRNGGVPGMGAPWHVDPTELSSAHRGRLRDVHPTRGYEPFDSSRLLRDRGAV